MSIYFFYLEATQIAYTGSKDYFRDYWNYIDVFPIFLVITVVSLKLRIFFDYNDIYEDNTFIYTIHSLASLGMWLKLIFFLRLFESTGHLISTLLSVFFDMKVFLLLLSIFYMGFGEAFLRISEVNAEKYQFIQNFADAFVYLYRLSMGDF